MLPDPDDPDLSYASPVFEVAGPVRHYPCCSRTSFDHAFFEQETYATNPKSGEEGERASPYKDGLFRVQMQVEQSYPMTAPSVKLLTKIWHPNISEDGSVCADFLSADWSREKTVRDVLLAVRALLANPNPGLCSSFPHDLSIVLSWCLLSELSTSLQFTFVFIL